MPVFWASQAAAVEHWVYPMGNYGQRITVKNFGTLVDDAFYKGKEELFPFNRFYGYHAGVDLETFPEEKNKDVPVYAVSAGTIVYIGSLKGYGGVMLVRLTGENHIALYGHVKINKDPSFKVGDTVSAGQRLTYLGDEFSSETSGERKHLHFGIYKGDDLYFHGHESSLTVLNVRWENPTEYLKQKGAVDPVMIATSRLSPTQIKLQPTPQTSENIASQILRFVKGLFGFK